LKKLQRYTTSFLLSLVLAASLLFAGAPQAWADQPESPSFGAQGTGKLVASDTLAAGFASVSAVTQGGGAGGTGSGGSGGFNGSKGGAGGSGELKRYSEGKIIVVFEESRHLDEDIETLISDMDALVEELQDEADNAPANNSPTAIEDTEDIDAVEDEEVVEDTETQVELITEDKEIGNIAIVDFPEIIEVEAAIEEALSNPAVKAAFPNYYIQLFENDAIEKPQGEGNEAADEELEAGNETSDAQASESEQNAEPVVGGVTSREPSESQDEAVEAASDDETVAPLSATIIETLRTAVNDPGMNNGKQYGPEQIKAPEAWDYVRTNNAVTVAVIDTGARLSHEDLVANIDMVNAWDVANNQRLALSVSQGKVPFGGDADEHGTHVSGIVAGTSNNGKGISGTSYNATILPVCVCDEQEQWGITLETLFGALDYLNNLKASGKAPNLRVINMSLGAYFDKNNPSEARVINTLAAYINRAEQLGVLSVAAASNSGDYHFADGLSASPAQYPSDFDNVVSVTSVAKDKSIAVYSDYNSKKNIAAPGGGAKLVGTPGNLRELANGPEIYSTYCFGNNQYGDMLGTSMASPAVAGVAALIWATNPNLTPAQVRTTLLTQANTDPYNLSSFPYAGPPNRNYGVGIVNAEKVVRATYQALTYQPIGGASTISLTLGYSRTVKGYAIPGLASNTTMAVDAPGTANNTAKATVDNNSRSLIIPAGLGIGSYKVMIKVTGPKGSATKMVTVNVDKIPTISGNTSAINLTEGYKAVTRNFTFGGTPAPSVSITNSKGIKATLKNGVLTIPAGLKKGTYKVTITASNRAATVTAPITVKVSRINYAGVRTIGIGKKVLGVQNKSTNSKASIELQTANYGPEQRFRFTRVESASTKDYYIITDVLSNKTLEVSDKLADGTLVWQNKTTKKKNQRFSITKNPKGGYWVSPKGSSLVLSLKNGKTSTGSKLVLAKKSKTAKAQRFKLTAIKQPLANGTYTFAGLASGKALEVKNLKTNAPLRLNKAKGSAKTQKFKLKYNKKTGYYTITPVSSKLVLDVKGSSVAAKSPVQLAKAKSSSYSQKWYLKKTSGGTYTLINAKSGKALEPKGLSKKNKTPVLINNIKNTSAQKWKLKKE